MLRMSLTVTVVVPGETLNVLVKLVDFFPFTSSMIIPRSREKMMEAWVLLLRIHLWTGFLLHRRADW